MPPRRPLHERFWEKVDRRGPNECWLWTASINTGGYGQIGVGRRPQPAHQVAWELLVGPRTPGLTLDHLCRERRCVNPAHLEEVTAAENTRRGAMTRVYPLKTHCKRGHEFSEDNTIITKAKTRVCRVCYREWHRKFERDKRARVRAQKIADGTLPTP